MSTLNNLVMFFRCTDDVLHSTIRSLSLDLIYRRPLAIIADEDLVMLAIYENISFLPSPTIADRLRSSAMNQKSLFLAIIGDHRRWREVNENTIGDHPRWSLDSRLPCSCQGSKIARWLRSFRSVRVWDQWLWAVTWAPMRSEMKPSPIVCGIWQQTHVLISQAPQGPHRRWSPTVCDMRTRLYSNDVILYFGEHPFIVSLLWLKVISVLIILISLD